MTDKEIYDIIYFYENQLTIKKMRYTLKLVEKKYVFSPGKKYERNLSKERKLKIHLDFDFKM